MIFLSPGFGRWVDSRFRSIHGDHVSCRACVDEGFFQEALCSRSVFEVVVLPAPATFSGVRKTRFSGLAHRP